MLAMFLIYDRIVNGNEEQVFVLTDSDKGVEQDPVPNLLQMKNVPKRQYKE